jgi:geranylgeranyl pyrophosphate synthase
MVSLSSWVHQIESRFTKEIIQDLATTYEMPSEAVQWVRKMIKYTVDGGKMNRGLATVSVIRTFAEQKGQKLTNKVSFLSHFFPPLTPPAFFTGSCPSCCSWLVH